jgi:FkbH-like protein
VIILPSSIHYVPSLPLHIPAAEANARVKASAASLLALADKIQEHSPAEILLANLPLWAGSDPGPYRSRSAASRWSLTMAFNSELGQRAPSRIHLCDIGFLSAGFGANRAVDYRAWLESKQPYSFDFMATAAAEMAFLVRTARKPAKKVVVLDLDNTLWGGVIGDDGLAGIELGTSSPRGEAFAEFQRYLLRLRERGFLLAVCSKNEKQAALLPFEHHSEMALKTDHISSFQANWDPKPQNLARIAAELDLGLDSLVFLDDNPAEIEIVRQLTPEVECVHLGDDPAEFIGRVDSSRLLEISSLTEEDVRRPQNYHQAKETKKLRDASPDLDSYLESLVMEAELTGFGDSNRARIAQLVNKSNQFNLTTIRRTEAEIAQLLKDGRHECFCVRLRDRFSDHGVISAVILEKGRPLKIDTWVMSCRVLNRGVEALIANEIFRRAKREGATAVEGRYLPSGKNKLVEVLYPAIGFIPVTGEAGLYRLEVTAFADKPHKIAVARKEG